MRRNVVRRVRVGRVERTVVCARCQSAVAHVKTTRGRLVWLAAVNEMKSVTVGEEYSLDCEKGIVEVATNGR